MSILIKGMEMPKDGHWGTVSIPFYIHGDGSVSDSKGHVIGNAVYVPPHGRLIDADEMKESIRKQAAFLKLMGGEFAKIAETLANHLEWYIIQEIKDDSNYDSIDYLCSLVHVYEKCKEATDA